MKTTVLIRLFCVLTALLLSLSACLPRPANNGIASNGDEFIEKEFVPATDSGESSKLGVEYSAIAELVEKGEGITTATDADFKYADVDGGVQITEYIGKYDGDGSYLILEIPGAINDKSVVAIGSEAFAYASKLDAVIIPDSVKTLDSLAFYGCSYLKYVKLGNGIKTVGNYAFSMCNKLFAIDFSAAESIGLGALTRCDSINVVKLSFVGGGSAESAYLGYIFGANNVEFNAEYVPASLRTVVLSDECKSIPNLAFYKCENLTSVVISGSVESIGIRSFYKCRSLVDLKLGDGVRSIGDDAFFGCDNLKTVQLDESLESMGMQVFFGCSALENIVLPTKLSEIKPSTFYGCKSLVNVDLANVKIIGKDAFYGCDSLISPDTSLVERIDEGNDKLTDAGQ